MRRLLILLATLMAVISLQAGEVTEQQALQKAEKFLKGKKIKGRARSSMRRAGKQPDFGNAFYVFNAENKDGFVIISGDDRTEEVLGYSDTGEMNLDSLPPNLEGWLKGYQEQIESLGSSQVKPTRRSSKAAIPALIKTKWNQGYPYNLHCPEIEGTRCVTGCTATAMAQLLYYYKYPKKEVPGMDAYTTVNLANISLKVDALESTTFDWKKMRLLYYSTDYEADYVNEIAKLMRYCGQLVHMKYGDGASAADVWGKTFMNWGYSQGKDIYRSNYPSDNDWESIIYEELVAKRPVLYAGFPKDDSGHEFICDGYDGNGLFHMNWGWGGSYDGYYILSNLNPGANDFSESQRAIIKLKPAEGGIPPNLEGTEFTASTAEGVIMNFMITYDDGNERTCEVSRYNSDIEGPCIDRDYKGSVSIPSEVYYDGNTYQVTGIGPSAFSYKYRRCSLSSIKLPNTIAYIETNVFFFCPNLQSIEIPASVKYIAPEAFSGNRLSSLIINDLNPIYYDGNANAVIQRKTNKLIAGTKGTVIPTTIEEIGNYAFSCVDNLRLTIPSTIKTIGYGAFMNCMYGIVTAMYTEPPYVPNAFLQTEGISNIILIVPEGTKQKYLEASGWNDINEHNIFEGAEFAEFRIEVPGGPPVWFYVNGKSTVKVARLFTQNVVSYDVEAEPAVDKKYFENTYTAEGNWVSRQYSSLRIPATVEYQNKIYTVTEIGDYAFDGVGFESISLPSTLERIGSYAFSSNYYLTELVIPKSVISISEEAIKIGQNLTSLIVEEGNPVYTSIDNALIENGEKLLVGCNGLDIPETVKKIAPYAFYNVLGRDWEQKKITIPASVTEIGSRAFYQSNNCTFIVSYNTPLPINSDVFSLMTGCKLRVPVGTKELYQNSPGWEEFGDNIMEMDGVEPGTEFQKTLSDGLEMWFTITGRNTAKVGRNDAWGNKAVDENLFVKNGSVEPQFTSVTIPASIVYEGRSYTVTEIGTFAFYNINIQNVFWDKPENITSIGKYAFYSCQKLQTFEVPINVIKIGEYAFTGTDNIRSFTVAPGNTTYNSGNGSNALIETATNTLLYGNGWTVIPSSVKKIGNEAMVGYIKGGQIIIPESVTEIEGLWNFSNYSESMFIVGENALQITLDNYSFSNPVRNGCVLLVPVGMKKQYQSAAGWSAFGDNIFEGFVAKVNGKERSGDNLDDKTSIKVDVPFTYTGGNTLMVGCNGKPIKNIDINPNLCEIVIPEKISHGGKSYTVTTIGAGAFLDYNNKGLSKIEIPATIETIEPLAFCTFGLTDLVSRVRTPWELTNVMYPYLDQAKLHIPEGTKEAYSAVGFWGFPDANVIEDISPYISGDANGDGAVNVTDIVIIVDHILQKNPTGFVVAAADVNGDGNVNVTDVVAVVDIILNKHARNRAPESFEISDGDYLTLTPTDDNSLSLDLDNHTRYVAAQMDIRLSAGQMLEDVTLNRSRKNGQQLSWAGLGDGRYRVVVFGMGQNSFRGNEGELLSIQTTGNGEMTIDNIIFVTDGQQTKHFAPLTSGTTGISTVMTLDRPCDIYDLQGRKVRSQVTTTEGLPSGVYVVNGRKTMVR